MGATRCDILQSILILGDKRGSCEHRLRHVDHRSNSAVPAVRPKPLGKWEGLHKRVWTLEIILNIYLRQGERTTIMCLRSFSF